MLLLSQSTRINADFILNADSGTVILSEYYIVVFTKISAGESKKTGMSYPCLFTFMNFENHSEITGFVVQLGISYCK